MALTKGDYVLIAGTLNRLRRAIQADPGDTDRDRHEAGIMVATIDQIGDDLGDRFAARSATFRPDTFRTAVRKEN